jgi:hypothetical protein
MSCSIDCCAAVVILFSAADYCYRVARLVNMVAIVRDLTGHYDSAGGGLGVRPVAGWPAEELVEVHLCISRS